MNCLILENEMYFYYIHYNYIDEITEMQMVESDKADVNIKIDHLNINIIKQ